MNLPYEKLKEWSGQLEVLKTYYARLSDRERVIVLSSAAAGAVFLLFLIYGSFAAITAAAASGIEKNREALKRIEEMQARFLQTERQVREMEQMIRRTPPDFQLATHLEKLAQRNGVAIESIKDRAAPGNDYYRETQATVLVKQITLRTLINLLFDIENSEQLLRVTSLQVKPNFQDPTQLNATFAVSTFQAVQP
jgi:type II secretory pathway component PulM